MEIAFIDDTHLSVIVNRYTLTDTHDETHPYIARCENTPETFAFTDIRSAKHYLTHFAFCGCGNH